MRVAVEMEGFVLQEFQGLELKALILAGVQLQRQNQLHMYSRRGTLYKEAKNAVNGKLLGMLAKLLEHL